MDKNNEPIFTEHFMIQYMDSIMQNLIGHLIKGLQIQV